MSKTREQKSEIIEKLKDDFSEAQSIVLTDYRGLAVKDETDLRKKVRETGSKYAIIKDTLAILAAKESGHEDLDKMLTGPTAAVFGFEDPVSPVKVLSDFAEDHEEIKIKGGLVEGKILGADELEALAKLPPRDELLSMLAREMQAPISGLACSLSGIITKLLYALNAVENTKDA